MSDYLNNLAAKSLNLTEVIQPRLASLFEPPSVAGGPVSGHFFGLETGDDEHLPGEPSLETPLPAQVPLTNPMKSRPSILGLKRPPDTLQQQPGSVADKSTGQHLGQLASRQPPPLIVPQPVETRPDPPQPPPNPARTTVTRTPAASLSPGAVRPSDTEAVQRSHPDAPVSVPVTAGHETGAAASRKTGGQEGQAALEQNIQPIVDERVVLLEVPRSQNVGHPGAVSRQAIRPSTPATVVAQPHVTLYREPPAPASTKPMARISHTLAAHLANHLAAPGDQSITQSEPPECEISGIAAPEPTPTIRVTIGRVDVRAIMPASPAPRPTPTRRGPALSLEDYLKQRQGGRR